MQLPRHMRIKMKNLKTLINVLLIVLPTSGAASTMSCDRYGYVAYEYLSKYNSTLSVEKELAYWSMGSNWTGAKNGTAELTNTSNVNIRVHLMTVSCGDVPQSKCRSSLTRNESGQHTVPANSTVRVPITYVPAGGGTYRGIIYLEPDSYVMESVNTSSGGGGAQIRLDNVTVDSQHALTYTDYGTTTLVRPRLVGTTSLTLPDTFVYDSPLDTGVGANKPFTLTNSTTVPITLKVDKIFGDNTFVTVGNETLTEGDQSRPITGMSTVGLYLPEHAEPGTKSASVVASWTCP